MCIYCVLGIEFLLKRFMTFKNSNKDILLGRNVPIKCSQLNPQRTTSQGLNVLAHLSYQIKSTCKVKIALKKSPNGSVDKLSQLDSKVIVSMVILFERFGNLF